MNGVVEEMPGIAVDYFAVVDPSTFERPADFNRDLLIAGAVNIGKTRLIDNVRIDRRMIPHTSRVQR